MPLSLDMRPAPGSCVPPPRGTLAILFLTVLIDAAGVGLIMPVLPALIEELAAGGIASAARWSGWLIFVYASMQFLFGPLLGGLSDRFGRRPVLLAAMLGFAVDYAFLAFAPSLWLLFVGRAIAGLTGACGTTAMAYVADVSASEDKSRNFGFIYAGFGLGFIVGPVFGGLLGSLGTRLPFHAAAVLCLLNFALTVWRVPESLPRAQRRALALRRLNPLGALLHVGRAPRAAGLLLALGLVFLAMQSLISTWSFFGIARLGWNESAIGGTLAFYGVLYVLVQALLVRHTTARFGEAGNLYLGIGLHALGLALLAFSWSTWSTLLFIVPYALGHIGAPSAQAMLSQRVPADCQGELQGVVNSLVSLAAIAGPPVMSGLFALAVARGGPAFSGIPFLFGAALMLAGLQAARRTAGAGTRAARPDAY
ncbi:TCR/Tet family MFS transporter [Burkholderia stagnalis]